MKIYAIFEVKLQNQNKLKLSTNILFSLFFFLNIDFSIAQEIDLILKSVDSIENSILSNINFKKRHSDSISIQKEIYTITELLKKRGYFFNNIDSLITHNKKKTAFISLHKQTSTIIISTLYNQKKETVTIEKLQSYLDSISYLQEKKGKLFSEVTLKHITLKKDTLFASLNIKQSIKRKVDNIIIKGYPEFSKKNMARFLDIDKGIINNKKLDYISNNTNNLNFIKEIKPPQILFKKDSTLLYLYIKKKKNNSFDGIINFTSKENEKGLLFTGHLKLDLNNTFNSGEEFKIHWLANGEQRQSFLFSTKLPYILNTPITPEIIFKIHKQDSTFLNNSSLINLTYPVNRKTDIALTYDRKNSKNTINNLDPLLYQNYKSDFIGFTFTYENYKKNNFYLKLSPLLGNRNSTENKEQQFKFTSKINYTHQINKKNTIYISNTTGFINSDNLLINELFRIGGSNSIRGFNEESIFSSKFSYFNTEYRYKTTQKSYIHSIIDIGFSENIEVNETLSSLGLGYNKQNSKTSLKIGIITEKRGNNKYDFNNPKLIIQLVSFF